MFKVVYWCKNLLAAVALSLTFVPMASAQLTELEFQKGRARTACRNLAEQQSLFVNEFVIVIPISNAVGEMVGSDVVMNVVQGGSNYDIRCTYDNATSTATISNLPNPNQGTASPTNGTFMGRGLARGSIFGDEQVTDATLNLNGRNYSFAIAVPPGTGTQVNYIGTVTRLRQSSLSGSGNSFIMQGRVQSFAASDNGMQLVNVAGNCEIEVFDARVISTTCNTRLRNTRTHFDGLHQF